VFSDISTYESRCRSQDGVGRRFQIEIDNPVPRSRS
jgi:hypothetical protein